MYAGVLGEVLVLVLVLGLPWPCQHGHVRCGSVIPGLPDEEKAAATATATATATTAALHRDGTVVS